MRRITVLFVLVLLALSVGLVAGGAQPSISGSGC